MSIKVAVRIPVGRRVYMFDTDQGARIVWNNLRARHYSVLILMAIVALETSAIAIDRFVLAESEEAFVVESSFQNNSFIRSFRMADASCAVLPVRINDFSVAHENNVSSNIYVSPLLENKKESTVTTVAALPAEDHIVSQRVSADFVAASGNQDSYSNYIEYSVQPGDNISNIAEMCGTKTDAIKKANNLDNSIKAGQTIVVPTQRTHMVYTVKKGDSLSRIASRFNVSMENLINANSLKTHVLMADQKIIIPVAKTEAGLALVKSPTSSEERTKKVALVRSENLEKVKDSSKLQMIKLDNKLQMVAAAAPAQKSEISFDDDSKKTSSTAVAKAKTPAKESVELKLNNSTRASVASADTKKSVKAAETAKAEIAKTAANAVAIKQEAEADLEDESEEVESFNLRGEQLYKTLNSTDGFEDEEESPELKYLTLLREIRDKQTDLYAKIAELPKKIRTARNYGNIDSDSLVTFFRKGKLRKFCITDGINTREIPFDEAILFFECDKKEQKKNLPNQYFDFINKNKTLFNCFSNFM
mgnify:CR=1 FL=1